jgi:hypothetical protein
MVTLTRFILALLVTVVLGFGSEIPCDVACHQADRSETGSENHRECSVDDITVRLSQSVPAEASRNTKIRSVHKLFKSAYDTVAQSVAMSRANYSQPTQSLSVFSTTVLRI